MHIFGQLMSTKSFDQKVGRGRGSRGDSHAGSSPFPREPPVPGLWGLQVQGRKDNSARSAAWEPGESAAPEALGKAATAWVTRHRAESQLCSFREGLLAVQKAEALKAPCDVWLSGWCCLCSKDQRPAQLKTQQQQV